MASGSSIWRNGNQMHRKSIILKHLYIETCECDTRLVNNFQGITVRGQDKLNKFQLHALVLQLGANWVSFACNRRDYYFECLQ
jgi:hypothetical protein